MRPELPPLLMKLPRSSFVVMAAATAALAMVVTAAVGAWTSTVSRVGIRAYAAEAERHAVGGTHCWPRKRLRPMLGDIFG